MRILGVNHVLVAILRDRRISLIESVLGLEEGDVRIYLSPLTSLLEVSGSDGDGDGYITFYHSSFMDYLYAQERSKGYYVDDQTSHTLVVQWVLQAFTPNSMYCNLQFILCYLGSADQEFCSSQCASEFTGSWFTSHMLGPYTTFEALIMDS